MDILQLIVYGIIYGSILSLAAIGLSLTFAILRYANFAHGDLMSLGAYYCLVFYTTLGWPFVFAVVAALILTAISALIIDKLVFRNFREAPVVIRLISSFGMALIIRSLIQIIWGPDSHVYDTRLQMAQNFAGIRFKPDQLTILICTLILMVGVYVFLQKTRIGKAMRAVADNPKLARLSGINTDHIIIWTWVLGASLAAFAGIFLGLDTRLHPEMGWHILLPVFAAVILGGIGNPLGAGVGGFIVGISQELSTILIDPAYKPAIAFAIMVGMLILRPKGLFPERKT